MTVCYCAEITAIETRTRVVILQHPRERGMPIGTARMAHLCLPNSSLHVGVKWDGTDTLADACGDPGQPPVLLYPSETARDLSREPPAGPVTLIVVDGTWSQAKNLIRDNPQLAALPRYSFTPPKPSNYRIRKEPTPEYVSTLEALMHVLGVLEGDVDRFAALMAPMNSMVDAQLRAKAESLVPRVRLRRRREPHERLPVEIRERFDDLVLVFGDANAWPVGSPERELGDELIHWVARRPSTGATLSVVLAPRLPLAPDIPLHTELDAESLRRGAGVDQLFEEFDAFTKPTDVIASWGHHSLRMFQDCGGALSWPFLDLRETARALAAGKVGPLEGYSVAAGSDLQRDLLPGRAGRRLGMLGAILTAWRSQIPALGEAPWPENR